MIHNRSKLTPWPLPRHALLHSQRPHQRSLTKPHERYSNIARGKSTGQLSKSKYKTYRDPGIFAKYKWSDFPTAKYWFTFQKIQKPLSRWPEAPVFFHSFSEILSINKYVTCARVDPLPTFGIVIPTFCGNPYIWYVNPYYWVDDHSLWK